MITQFDLQRILSYDPSTGVFTWINPTSNRVRLNDVAGCLGDDGYLKIQLMGNRYKSHRLAWLYCHGEFPEFELDHIDGVRVNNQLSNLRLATSKQNKENVKLKITNTTGYRGIHWDKSRQKWLAHITHNRKFHNLGRFNDINDALKAVITARNQFFTHHNTCYSS
jgi:hypothetical protein